SAAVYAFSASDGTIRWQVPVTGCLAAPMDPPLVADGVVYVSLTGHFSGGIGCKPTGWVYALRASDGHVLWHVPFSQSVWPTLALTNGVLIISNSTDNKYPATSWLMGLRARDGKQLWRVTRATDKIEFAADSGVVVIKSTAGIRYDSGLKVEALRASDGASLWASAVIPSSDPVYFMDPLLANGMVYIFSASSDLYALRASDGREVWRYQTSTRSIGIPVAANGRLYMGVGSTFDVLDATSGTLLSAHLLFDPSAASNGATPAWSAPVVTTSVIFVSAGFWDCSPGFICHGASIIGKLYALDIATGKVLWQYQPREGTGVTAPVLGA
ncbi:MAG TPA: PQQ-binding-like beta-propeller repeat protein, partial [Ktedonobacterales bacterium]|nr:PQQ-binding-like beta-propeller repeat protein [Ktedonobacterales bacterium]